MPNILENERSESFPHGPESPVEGPWFTIGADQLRKIATVVADHNSTVRIEYRGADYWEVTLLRDGEVVAGPRMVFPLEPH